MKFMTSIILLAISSLTAVAPRLPCAFTNERARIRANASSVTESATTSGLPIITDDFERARAEANKRKLPLFVEVWAPW